MTYYKNKFKRLVNKIASFVKSHKMAFIISIIVSVIIILVFCTTVSLIVYFSFSNDKTYANALIFEENVGRLEKRMLDKKLTNIKTKFESRKVIINHKKDKWTYDTKKLGINFYTKITSQSVWGLNKICFIEKVKLVFGIRSSKIQPTILVDNNLCKNTLSEIIIKQVDPIDAKIVFNKNLIIEGDKTGYKYNPELTCKDLKNVLHDNVFNEEVHIEKLIAKITKDDIKSKFNQINSMVGKPLILKYNKYERTLTQDQLINLLEISKIDNKLTVGWSDTKINELINEIASNVDTYDESPSLGTCQYLIHVGGNWLDKDVTKKIFNDLVTNKNRTYNLTITHHDPNIGTRTPVPSGKNGTVYLTFDDGMSFADQIMDYASCYGVKVTFFELGSRVDSDSSGLQRAITEGHAVQTHGYEHATTDYGTGHTYDWQYNDIAHSINVITIITGVRPTYFRPPGGNRTQITYDAASANNVKLILWSVSSADTVAEFDSSAICNNVLNGAFDGASILMHSTKQQSADAVPCIIEGLSAKGFNMVALR